MKTSFDLFSQFKNEIEDEILKCIPSFGEKTKLRQGIEYALTSGGKRLRPILVYLVAESVGKGFDVTDAALAVEFFHTASLIADDLPCMDNDDMRRNKPSLHKIYGESVALLASYALITSAFERIHKNGLKMRNYYPHDPSHADQATLFALGNASFCSGIHGATGGQFIDLFPDAFTLESALDLIYKKTVTLFEVSFVFGYLFGGGDFDKLPLVKKAAYHLGLSFQIADDLCDYEQDKHRERVLNIATLLGKEKGMALFQEEMQKCCLALEEVELNTPSLERVCEMITNLAIHS